MVISVKNKNDFEFEQYMLNQAAAHPALQPRDAVKLCFQAAFGAEHLLTQKDWAHKYLVEEFSNTPADSSPIFERVSNDYCRCNIGAWKAANLPVEWMFNMFYSTASSGSNSAYADRENLFDSYLGIAGSLSASNTLPFSTADWSSFLEYYNENGHDENNRRAAVHHSDIYRDAEHPAYRIVKSGYIKLLPILTALNSIDSKGNALVIAIDGRAAAGKTTAAALLCEIFDADAVHMDDFFLPKELRTPSRLQEPGGNVHYERFCSEVLPKLHNKEAFTYQRFDCSTMNYGSLRTIKAGSVRIVEGSYSCQPIFKDYMNLRVFCDVSPEEQLKRITSRNGDAMAENFKARWIPMEETYFNTYSTRSCAQIILD